MTEISKMNNVEAAKITRNQEMCKENAESNLQLLFDEDIDGAIIPKTLLSELNGLNFRKEVITKQIETLRKQENNYKAEADKIKDHIRELEDSIKQVQKENSFISEVKSFFTGKESADERVANLKGKLAAWKGKLYETNEQAISNSASRAQKEQILKQIETEIVELASNIKTYTTPKPGSDNTTNIDDKIKQAFE